MALIEVVLQQSARPSVLDYSYPVKTNSWESIGASNSYPVYIIEKVDNKDNYSWSIRSQNSTSESSYVKLLLYMHPMLRKTLENQPKNK